MPILTADTITDEQIRELRENAHPDDWRTRREADYALYADDWQVRASGRRGCAEIFNASVKKRCPARDHERHIGDVCVGTCCTNCGGPIDENEECRC